MLRCGAAARLRSAIHNTARLSTMKPTADISDDFAETRVLQANGLKDYGGVKLFFGTVATVDCFEDNTMASKALDEPGNGRVLFVDGKGSLNCALFGDMMGAKVRFLYATFSCTLTAMRAQAIKNGWSGVVINGAVRDVAQLMDMKHGFCAYILFKKNPRANPSESRLGVKALGTCPKKSLKGSGNGKIGVPLNMLGLTAIVPGMYCVCASLHSLWSLTRVPNIYAM